MEFVTRVIASAVIIAAISLVSRRVPLIGAIIASLPLTSILAMIWLYRDTRSVQQVRELSNAIFWMVAPSLVFFVTLSVLLRNHLGFWASVMAATLVMIATYTVYLKALAGFGIRL
jgi:uncharacterized membrane protein (GlpM family)